MTPGLASEPRVRRHRGRPQRPISRDGRRGAGATQARVVAARVLERVERASAFADLALHHALVRSPLGGADRALATELVYGTLRWRGRIDFLLSKLLERDLARLQPLVQSTLRLGAYQILFSERVPATTAVDQSVHCTRALGAERATGLVNAVLRRLAREHRQVALPELADDALAHLTHALSLPSWLAQRWLEELGPEEAAALARAGNRPPPLSVRVNRARSDVDELLAELRTRFPEARRCEHARSGLILGRRGNAGVDPAFLSGAFTIQDEASQLVVELLDPQLGESVLDVCAAPGGKATAIAERVGESGRVVALDRHRGRLGLLARDSRRLGLSWIRPLERDASQPLEDLLEKTDSGGLGGHFDRVLVDAPCSGLGTLRRNPDARWRIQPGDPARLAPIQRAILESAAPLLRPGGRLVYSTCTVAREENEAVLEAFLGDAPHFRQVAREALPGHLLGLLDERGALRCWPHRHDTDGFYAVCLERSE